MKTLSTAPLHEETRTPRCPCHTRQTGACIHTCTSASRCTINYAGQDLPCSAVPQHPQPHMRAASSTALAPPRHHMAEPFAPSCDRLNTPLCSEGSWEYTHHAFPQCTSGQDGIQRVKGWMIPVGRGVNSTPLLDLLLKYRPRLPHQDFHCPIHIMELHNL
jgi:hypothetical protein